MNAGKFLDSIHRTIKILKKCELLESIDALNVKKTAFNKFSKEFIHVSLKSEYRKVYMMGIEQNEYDILLNDNAYFQFSSEPNKARFAFYPNPDPIKNYREFLSKFQLDYNKAGDIFMEDFHQYLAENTCDELACPVRYDYDESLHDALIHPTSHIHIGIDNKIRLACKVELTPLAFVIIIMKNFYLDYWNKMLFDSNMRDTVLSVKKSCDEIKKELFSEEEKEYFYIG